MAAAAAVTALTLLVAGFFLHQAEGASYVNANDKCDIFQGKWVYDPKYPLYNARNCSFIQQEFDCQKNGRPDSLYLHYRWKPSSCNLPRFRGEVLLKRFRGKRIMFVGDSISLNQWQSLTCMLHLAVPDATFTSFTSGGVSTFAFPAYDVSLMFSRNAFLVDIVGDQKLGRVLKLNSISSGETWKRSADVLIFDSWHWWLHSGRKQGWDVIQDHNRTYKDMDRLVAYRKAMNTWADWVNSNVNASRTKVFFRGVSPDHMNSSDWGDRSEKTCRGETQPVSGHKYGGGTHPAQAVVEDVMRKVWRKARLLNVTNMSQLRKDGHPSIYGFGGARAADCSHWCLPGVPDTWNQLLYALLIPESK